MRPTASCPASLPGLAICLAVLPVPTLAAAQAPADPAGTRAEVRAVVEEALERVSEEDMAGLADLMLEGAAVASAGVNARTGESFHRIRTRNEIASGAPDSNLVERGFDPEVRVDGPMATVRLPYDFYEDGEWSHCGVDVFTLLRVEEGWRIATITYTVQQPPDCRRHPEGPPGG